jgi:hypothetical protein
MTLSSSGCPDHVIPEHLAEYNELQAFLAERRALRKIIKEKEKQTIEPPLLTGDELTKNNLDIATSRKVPTPMYRVDHVREVDSHR